MKIFIVGAGEVGIHIASSLIREHHDLVIIEKDGKKVSALQRTMDVLAVTGDGCNPMLLKAHGVADAELFFAVSNRDSVNLLSALTARSYGVPSCVVRIGDPDLGRNPLLTRDKAIVPLYPERLVAEEIFSLTQVPGVGRARFFGNGRLVMLAARPSIKAAVYGKPLRELRGPEGWILAGIRRSAEVVIPCGETTLRPGDLLYAVGRTDTIVDYLASIGVESRPTRKVVIAGAGQVGTWLARSLVQKKIQTTVIQRGASRAFDLAAEVPEALVLRGDATDPRMLKEAGVGDADYFVATTQQDENNLLSSLLAREAGARAVVALSHSPEFLNLMRAGHVDVPLSPRLLMAGSVLRMVHRREIVSLDLVGAGDAEVVEFEVPARARVLKRPLGSLSFPRQALVGAVLRGEEIFVPKGDFQFEEGDRALVFALTAVLPDLERIFRGR